MNQPAAASTNTLGLIVNRFWTLSYHISSISQNPNGYKTKADLYFQYKSSDLSPKRCFLMKSFPSFFKIQVFLWRICSWGQISEYADWGR